MKVACVGYLHGAGGAERQIIMLANELSGRGHEVSLIILVENKSKYNISKNVKIYDLTDIEIKGRNKILKRFQALKCILGEIKPDISIHFWLQSAYFCAMMAKSVSGQVIYSERGDPGDKEYKGILGMVRFITFMRIDGLVFQSKEAQKYFKKSIINKSVVIHNSVFIPENKYLLPCKKREKKIVNVGRLHPQKNQEMLIRSFKKIADDFPEYILEIYGDGELKSDLLALIEDLDLQKRVFLKGTTTNILDYIYTASLFILSSDYEGMPNALMEAMAIGVPCISTDCRPGGARALIKHGINGWITPIGDVDSLALLMDNVLQKKENTDLVIENAMKIRKTHSKKAVFDKWEQYCKDLVGI